MKLGADNMPWPTLERVTFEENEERIKVVLPVVKSNVRSRKLVGRMWSKTISIQDS